jgi:hypothetical protein
MRKNHLYQKNPFDLELNKNKHQIILTNSLFSNQQALMGQS